MKNIPLLVVCALFFAACHKKAVPTKTTNAVIVHPTKKETLPPPSKTVTEPEKKTDTPLVAPAAPVPAAMIVIDGYGKILTPQSKLPDQNIKPNYSQIARAFTPQEIANLKARHNMVPPKVLYVPDQYALKTPRGTYAVYKKKFWYWKKEDGLFYLDEIYYK